MDVNFISTVITSAATTGVLVWLFKSWISERLKKSIEYEYSLKLEAHKAMLKAEYDSQLTKLKAEQEMKLEHIKTELFIRSAERNTKFTKTFERMAEYLEGVYVRVIKISTLLNHYSVMAEVHELLNVEEFRKEIPKLVSELDEYYEPKQIYLPHEISVKIRRVGTKFSRIEQAITESIDSNSNEPLKKFNNDVTSFLVELENDILQSSRSLLGVETRRDW